jgi:hypothetical protein
LALMILIVMSCNNDKTSVFTLIPEYAISMYPERLAGKVERIIEKSYWANLDGKKYKKGNPITEKELDSLGWTSNYEVVFDKAGLLVTCSGIDETGKTIWVNEFLKENNVYTGRRVVENDSLSVYVKLKCDKNGRIIEMETYRAPVDTLIVTLKRLISAKGDTVESHWINNKGELLSKSIELWDDLGRHRQTTGYDKDGNFQYAMEAIYNDKGKPSNITWYDKEKNINGLEEFTYEYDEKGNEVLVYYKDKMNHFSIKERTYTYFE